LREQYIFADSTLLMSQKNKYCLINNSMSTGPEEFIIQPEVAPYEM